MSLRGRKTRKTRLFTDQYIKSLKPEDKMYQVRESRGFAIRVLPSGRKTWYFVYQLEKRRRQLNLGTYPHTTLKDAHEAYRVAYDLLQKGVDPQASPGSVSSTENDLENLLISELVKKYLLHIEGHLVPLSVVQQRRILEKEILPDFGHRKAKELPRRDAIALIEKIAKRAPGQARNVVKTARAMFTYALERDYIEHNPFIGIGRAVPAIAPRIRSRVLSPKEIGTV